ncbi:MAG: chaperone NapD, partial [Pseudomonadota bacterium]
MQNSPVKKPDHSRRRLLMLGGTNISGVVLRARPENVAAVRESLAALPGVEVHAASEDGRIVVTLEDAATASAA